MPPPIMRSAPAPALIVTEATQISPQGVGYPGTPGIHSAEQVAGWKRVTDAVHAAGGRIFLQLWHVGRISHPSLQPDGALPVAPSAIAPAGQAWTLDGMKDYVTPHALDLAEIAGVIEDYRTRRKNAHEAGFDGVEVHGANGYLIDQFLRDGANRRTDRLWRQCGEPCALSHRGDRSRIGEWGAERVGVRLSPTNPYNSMSDGNPAQTFGTAVERAQSLRTFVSARRRARRVRPGAGRRNTRSRVLSRLWRGPLIANKGYDRARAEAR